MFFGHEPKKKPFCEGCKNHPTVHINYTFNGEVIEINLCPDCPLLKNIQLDKSFDLSDLLVGLLSLDTKDPPQIYSDIQCKNCGMTCYEFIKIGKLGCSECYHAFSEQLLSLLTKIQGTHQHIGKNPFEHEKKNPIEETQKMKEINRIEYMLNLKDQMNQAIHQEDYERAAKIRDIINEIEDEENHNGNNNSNFHHN